MHFNSIEITNYKGFNKATKICLTDHINVVVGINNAGKSAFLETLRFWELRHVPHRNPDHNGPSPESPISLFEYSFEMEGVELINSALQRGLQLALPQTPTSPLNPDALLKKYQESELYIKGTAKPNNAPFNSFSFELDEVSVDKDSRALHQIYDPNLSQTNFISKSSTTTSTNAIGNLIWECAKNSVFIFNAERFRVGQCNADAERELRSDASNLPICLSRLQRNRVHFENFVQLVRSVVPQVKDLSAGPVIGNQAIVEVLIYSVSTDRVDLGIPLEDCGTGIAQVIAILFIIFTKPSSIIVIDEPNSFLHPSASKNLMRVIKRARNTQFIVSTHSVEVISALSPEQIVSVEWDENESASRVDIEDGASIQARRNIMHSLGFSYSDVFGCDVAIWVEGDTEKNCFDKIIDHSENGRPSGVEFISMPWASRVESKKRDTKEFFDLHRKASQGSVLWPPSIAFCFDSELRTEQEKEEIEREANGRAKFLPRRMYENYLCHPVAIAELIRTTDEEAGVTDETVSAWIAEHQKDPKYLDDPIAKTNPDALMRADIFLNDLLNDVTECRVAYDKVSHGIWLTEWLLENDIQHLKELREFVYSLYETATQA